MQDAKVADLGGLKSTAVDVKQRLSKALFELNIQLASCKSGALVQIWMPDVMASGSVVLSAQGLPFAIAGVGDLLALFRCVSCRYRFSTDVTRPALMGAIGRVYSSCEPEMSHNVQKYDRQVYLRVSEAQRCRVHSTLVMPVFDVSKGDGSGTVDMDAAEAAAAGAVDMRPVAVFELVQADRDVVFPEVIAQLRKCLLDACMTTSDPEQVTTSVGLRKWAMHVDGGGLLKDLMDDLGAAHPTSSSTSHGRLLLENDEPDLEEAIEAAVGADRSPHAAVTAAGSGGGGRGGSGDKAQPAGSFTSEMLPGAGTAAGGTAAAAAAAAVASGGLARAQAGHHTRAGSGSVEHMQDVQLVGPAVGLRCDIDGQDSAPDQEMQECAGQAAAAGGGAAHATAVATAGQVPKAGAEEAGDDKDEAQSQQQRAVRFDSGGGSLDAAAPATLHEASGPGPVASAADEQQQALNKLLQNVQQLLQQQQEQLQQQQQQKQQSLDPSTVSAAISTLLAAANATPPATGSATASSPPAAADPAAAAAASADQQQALLSVAHQLQQLQKQLAGSSPTATTSAVAAAAAADPVQQLQGMQSTLEAIAPLAVDGQQQGLLMSPPGSHRSLSSSGPRSAFMNTAAAGHVVDEGEEEDELLGSDDDDGEGGRGKWGGGGIGPLRPLGAGRKLTFEDLQAQFGLGLKEAAANLGICATTLKRACRRNGITRWPRRQIQKLNRTINQMGGPTATQPGPELDEMVASAIKKNLKPGALTPQVTASLQQQIFNQAGPSVAGGRSHSMSIPTPRNRSSNRLGSLNSAGNSGSWGGQQSLAATCGSVGTVMPVSTAYVNGFSFPGSSGDLMQVHSLGAASGIGGSLGHNPMGLGGAGMPVGMGQQQGAMGCGVMGPGMGPQHVMVMNGGGMQQQMGLQQSNVGVMDPMMIQQQHNMAMYQQQQSMGLLNHMGPPSASGYGGNMGYQSLMGEVMQHQDAATQQQQQGSMLSGGTALQHQASPQQLQFQQQQMNMQQHDMYGQTGPQQMQPQSMLAYNQQQYQASSLEMQMFNNQQMPQLQHSGSTTAASGAAISSPSTGMAPEVHQHQQELKAAVGLVSDDPHQQQHHLLSGLEAPADGLLELLNEDMLLDDNSLDLKSFALGGGEAAAPTTAVS